MAAAPPPMAGFLSSSSGQAREEIDRTSPGALGLGAEGGRGERSRKKAYSQIKSQWPGSPLHLRTRSRAWKAWRRRPFRLLPLDSLVIYQAGRDDTILPIHTVCPSGTLRPSFARSPFSAFPVHHTYTRRTAIPRCHSTPFRSQHHPRQGPLSRIPAASRTCAQTL